MSKKIAALVAAILSTACVGVVILLIGGAALFNPNGTVAAQSPAQASSGSVANVSSSSQAQVQQLQALVQQYQQREQQYQSREQQLQQQIQANSQTVQQAQQQMAQIQQLLQALQERGLITITQDGRIFINSR
jgi:predicted Rossmann fold nucleotide-binding protein DprA/Smf involved in DNA uptake